MATLYIVATPIGNLGDITLRALETLKSVDVIFAEDTRVTSKLLARYEIKKPLQRYDDNTHDVAVLKIVERLRSGESVALTTDAGTPGIADPGARLVAYVREHAPEISIVPIPGANALVTALSASGVIASQFTFLGYPPHKKGRASFFANLNNIKIRPVVLYESTHRLDKTLEALGDQEVIIVSELTKIHEEFWRGSAKGGRTYFVGAKKRGEFVIILP